MSSEITVFVEGMSCDGCVRNLTRKLKATEGVEAVEVVLTPRG